MFSFLSTHRSYRWIAEVVALTAVVLFGGYLRFVNLPANPHWYTDEATQVEIARNLHDGEVRYFAVGESTLLFSRMPLFTRLLLLTTTESPTMVDLRRLTAALGTLSVVLVYGVLRRSGDPLFALLGAGMMALYPSAVLYSRFGFSYNLLAPMMILVFGAVWQYVDTGQRWALFVAALLVGMGVLGDLWMLIVAGPLTLIVLAYRWRDALWEVPLTVAPIALYAVVNYLRVPEAFQFDAAFVLFRLNTMTLPRQIYNIALNVTTLIETDTFFLLALVGAILTPKPRMRGVLLVHMG